MPSFRPTTLSSDAVLRRVDATAQGLANAEAQQRVQRYGRNALPNREAISAVRTLVRQFQSSLVIILHVAAAVSFALGETLDGLVILAAVAINIVVGFFQEHRAERALEALQRVAAFTATVLRDGREHDVPSADVVPGDILLLHAGQKVPADARLLEAYALEVNEAALTGESAPVLKDVRAVPDAVTIPEQVNMVFSGTVVTAGRGVAVVTETGERAELGKVAKLMQLTVTEKTPLQRRLTTLSWQLTIVVLSVALLVFLLGLFRLYDAEQMFSTAVAIAVAAIPEGLAVVVTVILAIGMQHMLKVRALARSLLAAEALGSVTVIATDKTGTVTEGYMRVVKILTHDRDVRHPHRDPGEPDPSALLVLKIGALASDAEITNPDKPLEEWDIRGNLTERALVRAAAEAGFSLPDLRRQYTRVGEIPFDSSRRFMAVACEHRDDGYAVFTKGAPEVLLAHAASIEEDGVLHPFTHERRAAFEARVREMSSKGLRALAIGFRSLKRPSSLPLTTEEALDELVLVGVVGIQDPLREDAPETIRTLQSAGIRTVMLTGDNVATARTIAAGLGLATRADQVMDGRDLESLDANQLRERVADVHVFARVSPKDKLRIIDAWQARGEVVAMTGDGVNDAPALKSADVGVALGSGTDVAKEAADLVLLDNSLSTIAHAVFEGRVIYRNIKRVILYLLAGSFSEMFVVVGGLLLGWPLPLTAAQILWVNLVTDALPTIALTREKADPSILLEPPMNPKRPLVGPYTRFMAVVLSLISAGAALGLFALVWLDGQQLEYARTLAFCVISVSSFFYIFSTRALRQPLTSISFFGNPSLLLAIGFALSLQLLAVYSSFGQRVFGTVALDAKDWLLIVLVCLGILALLELSKVYFRRRTAAHISP